jgi:D-arabinitol dehydrogenase (NADP+)
VILEYLKTKKLNFRRIVNKTYRIEEWARCLEAVMQQKVVKAAIVFD